MTPEKLAAEIVALCRPWTKRCDDAKRIPDMLAEKLPAIIRKHERETELRQAEIATVLNALLDGADDYWRTTDIGKDVWRRAEKIIAALAPKGPTQ